MDGFLLIDKPAGPSSAQVVARLKRLLPVKKGPGRTKIGHGGTLDPLATGLLPLGLGKGTRRLQALLEGPKTYRFTVIFGTQTTTDDAEGTPTATSAHRPTAAQIQAILPQFTGLIEQTPPAFSALKVDGQRAYALARQGQTPTLESRPVTIHSLKLLPNTPTPQNPNIPLTSASFEADVSKGTYIRSLARDLALALGTVGHVGSLVRTRHGPFSLDQAVSLDKFAQTADIAAYLLPLDAPLAQATPTGA
jgi:tRNA pseudouridine55 synthase